MKIVIVGHAGSPDRGSEPGITWGWAWHLSQDHDVWLVNSPEFAAEIDRYLASHPNDRLRIVWVHSRRADPWHPTRSSTGIRFKIHYFLWLGQVQRVVKKLIETESIDIVHQVGLMTVSAPSRLWCLPVPFIWGPIGGGETPPLAFRRYYGKDWHREEWRSLRLHLVRKSRVLRLAVRHAHYLLTMNRETETMLVGAGADRKRLGLMIDSGVSPDRLRSSPRICTDRDALTLLWAGRLEARKALPILLDALASLRDVSSNDAPALPVRVLIAGEGPKRAEWERHAEKLGLAHCVTFLGMIAPTRMAELYEKADVFVFTSLRDAFGTVVTEALTHALPVILLNHHGCAAFVPDEAAIKIPVTTPAETVAALTAAIEILRQRPQQLQELSERALAAARQFQWPARAEAMTRIYKKVAQDVTRVR